MTIHSQCECREFLKIIDIVEIPNGLLNEEWAQRNHDQSLARLNERGGLTLIEALAIIQERSFHPISWERAVIIYQHILRGYNIGIKIKD